MCFIGWFQMYRRTVLCLCMTFLIFAFLLLMMVMWFLSQKKIIDRQFDGFCLLSLLKCRILVFHCFLILRLRFFALKIVFE